MTAAGAFHVLLAFVICLLSPSRAIEHAGPPATPESSAATEDVYGMIAVPGAVPVSLLIQNDGETDDRLLGASTPVAQRVELHHSLLQQGRRMMGSMPDGIVVPAGKTIVLEPAATHLMLLGLRESLVQGRTFPFTLRFERAGDVTVTVRVRRKVDAAGLLPIPPVTSGDLTISLASAPPAPALDQ